MISESSLNELKSVFARTSEISLDVKLSATRNAVIAPADVPATFLYFVIWIFVLRLGERLRTQFLLHLRLRR